MLIILADMLLSLMSDYHVTLVNDNMQEFYVRFHGPEESTCHASFVLMFTMLITSNLLI